VPTNFENEITSTEAHISKCTGTLFMPSDLFVRISHLIFVTEMCCVFFVVGTEFLILFR
jgi:hypothetical protein